jgi:2,4-dienoyl-CoA reductase-like NADH-dependent reductase (Old Yellow Enzyme family)
LIFLESLGMSLFTPLSLPNGVVIPNRIAKAAMEENMADSDHAFTRLGPKAGRA